MESSTHVDVDLCTGGKDDVCEGGNVKIYRQLAMTMDESDDLLANYFFCEGRDPQEIVVDVGTCHITRREMRTLLLDTEITSSIIDTFVRQMTTAVRDRDPTISRWYIPTCYTRTLVGKYLRKTAERCAYSFFGPNKYTGELGRCKEVYLPMNHGEKHWLLCIIDFTTCTVKICDSSIVAMSKLSIMNQVTKLVGYFLRLLRDHVYADAYSRLKSVDSFEICYHPWVPTQYNGTDCELYVCLMMEDPSNVPTLDSVGSINERRRLVFKLWHDESNMNNPLNVV